jgi:alpha-tubulin suppressor-like RCC1 family protein
VFFGGSLKAISLFVACTIAACAHAASPAVSEGNRHSLALHSDGTVRAWGDDSAGQLGLGRTLQASAPAIVAGIANVAQVASGSNHVVARLHDGTVWAWGHNDVGQLGDGTTTNRSTPAPVAGLSNVTLVAAGYDHSLALKSDGTVWSWGVNYHGELGYDDAGLTPARVPGISNIQAIAAGNGFSLALANDGTIWAWGENDQGQLGDGTFAAPYTGRSDARRVASLSGITRIACGAQFALAATSDGRVFAWGRNSEGELGNGGFVNSAVPRALTGITNATRLAGGADHALIALGNGSLFAWGGGYSGALGDGKGTPSAIPVRVESLTGADGVSAGIYFSVAHTPDGSVWAWGDNTYGEIGDGTTDPRLSPQRVAGLPAVISVVAGGFHAFALTADGHVYAWGANDYGELGDGVRPLRVTPAAVPNVSGVIRVAAGGTHSLALKSDGTLLAWGANGSGQLGDGTQTSRSSAGAVPGLGNIADIAGGYYFSAARGNDGSVWTWGGGYRGPLGLGNDSNVSTPTRVPGLPAIAAISAGPGHVLALASDGTVRAWGNNGAGEVGDGSTVDRLSPVAVKGLAGVKAVAAGYEHSLALASDGTVWSWGTNYNGELGDGSSAVLRALPARIPNLTSVTAIAAGGSFSLALRSDGTVWAWGANWWGQLGDGSGVTQTHPVQVAGLAGIVAISAGGASALALKSDGTVWAWGENIEGRVGDGTFATRGVPVVVVREDGAGTLEGNDWFLDLQPSVAKTIPADKVPIFLVVTANASGSVTATLRFRGQDIGTTSSVFAFAVAPSSSIPGPIAKDARLAGWSAKRDGMKDDSIACVLAQLNASGQLQAVSASSMQAYVSGVLGSQGQAVTLLNSTASGNASGATFYVGYGANGTTMINSGTNRSAVTVPGAVTCQPQAPQTGWWWNPAQPGRGFSIEVQGQHVFFAAFHYDVSGRSTWNVASGPTSLDGSLFNGDLLAVAGGQTLGGPYNGSPNVSKVGAITLAFSDASHGTMIWPGETVPIERMNLVPGGLDAPAQANQPENGWWWNPQESGRGFFIEWQAGYADIAGYMYDDAGNPVWYITVNSTPDARSMGGAWWSYANGQAMGAPWKQNTQTSNNVAPMTIQFSAPDTAILTLPNGRTTALTRQRY